MMIAAELDTVSTARMSLQHPINPETYAALEGHYEMTDDAWPYPPVLVVEDEGNGYTILDGHHRIQLAREWQVAKIPAYVVTVADYCKVLATHFGGSTPNRLADLDAHILCGGKAYSR